MGQQTTERAWQVFARTLPQGTRNCTDAREEICAFVGVNQHTVRRWITANSVSGVRGLTLIKLRCFLEQKGYEIAELRSLTQVSRTLAEILGYNLLSLEDACMAIEGEVSERAADRIYDLILGRTRTALKPKLATIKAFIDRHKDTLSSKKNGLGGHQVGASQVAVTEPRPTREVSSSDATPTRQVGHAVVHQLLVSLVPAFRKVVELVVSDEFSPQDRREIRKLVGDDLFRLSTAMNQLSSETGRQQFSTQKPPRET